MKRISQLLISFALVMFAVGDLYSQWSDNSAENDTIVAWLGDQISPALVSDGNRGAIVVWQDKRFNSSDIFAIRMHKSGKLMWTPGGEQVAQFENEQIAPVIIEDGDGGSFIAWQDHRSSGFGSVYAQQIENLDGQPQWAVNGIEVRRRGITPNLIQDGILGIIAASYAPALDKDLIAAQKVSLDADLEWGASTLPSDSASVASTETPPKLVSDFNGGAIFAWVDIRGGVDHEIYTARLDQSGSRAWTPEEIPLGTSATEGTEPAVLPDGAGGIIIAWISPQSPGSTDDLIMVQNLNGDGAKQWPSEPGVVVSTSAGSKDKVRITQADQNMYLVVWEDLSSGADKDIAAQRIASDGSLVPPLIEVVSASGAQRNPIVLANGLGEVVVAWEDHRNSTTAPDIYAQLVDASGGIAWKVNGEAVSTAPGRQEKPALAADGLGGAIIVWQDFRSGDYDIYSQRISQSGVLGEFRAITITSPTQSQEWEIGSSQRITWDFRGKIDSVSIELSRNGGQNYFAQDLLARTAPNTGSFVVDSVRGDPSQNCTVRIRAVGDEHIEKVSSVFTISPATPPAIDPNPVLQASLNDSVTISATSTDLSGVSSVSLNYRRGGARQFASVAMQRGEDDRFTGAIPPTAVTNRGLEYYVASTDSIGNSSTSDTFFVAVTFDAGVETWDIAAGSSQSSYHMISAPNQLDQTLADSIFALSGFGAYDTTSWRLFQFRDPVNVERDSLNAASFTFDPGTAYWIISARQRTIDFGAGISILTDSDYEITLHPGWNQVGNPFAFTIDWDDILAASGNPRISRPSTFRGSYLNPPTLEPFEGYFVYRFGATDTTLVFPPMEFAEPVALAKSGTESDWQLQITATCEQARDDFNFLGIDQRAALEWDRLDQPEPPPIGEFVSVYFPQHDWRRFASDYTSDYRPELGEGQIWRLNVRTNIAGSQVKLTFSGLSALPEDLSVVLLDQTLSVQQDLRQNPEYLFATGSRGATKSLLLLVGEQGFLADQTSGLGLVPTDFQVSQNFPNPFNPSTSIRFGLPNDENVTVRIYDLLGREVKTLINDEPHSAGFHVVTWTGQNKNGRAVASGLYIYRITAGAFSQTRKMLLVK
ncbi:MAG: T9SS type A sorting domain-containing protein [bacterium]